MPKPTDNRTGPTQRRRKLRSKNNVIQIAFRKDPAAPVSAPAEARSAELANDSVARAFSRTEVVKLVNLSPSALRSLDRNGIVSPSARIGSRRAYTFSDVIALRAARSLVDSKVRLSDVARAVGALREAIPSVDRPLEALRVRTNGRRVVVQSGGVSFEPLSGQTLLDFTADSTRGEVVRTLREKTSAANARRAQEFYEKASRLDENPGSFDDAEHLYRQAIAADPTMAIAYTNLGNVRFRRGDEQGAELLYLHALSLDDRQPEAHYNLGYVMLDRGEAVAAIDYFSRAITLDPRFADAHFNLAMALEQAGEHARARPHWRSYLALEPTGTWADIAREHLN